MQYIHYYFLYSMTFQVNSNGLLSFRTPSTYYIPVKFPLTNAIFIAPFWNEVDIKLAGQVLYRLSTNQSLLDAFQVHINESLDVYFPPKFLVIATWNRVAQLGGNSSVVHIDNVIV